jgi:uncharacterized protein (TIRG00374 family)
MAVSNRIKKTAITTLKISVSLGLYAYIFNKVGVAHLWSTMKQARPAPIVASILVYFVVQSISAYRWYLLLRPLRMRIPFSRILAWYFVGMYSNLFLPSAIGGDVVRVYYLNKHTRNLSGSTTSVFLDRDLGMAALLLIATLASALAGVTFDGVPLAPIFGLIAAAFVAANLAIFYKPTYILFHKLLKLFRLKKADERTERLFESVNSYKRAWRVMAVSMLFSILIQLGGILVNILDGSAIGLVTLRGAVDYLVFIPAIMLIIMVPLSVGGLGWREVSFIVLFKSVGVSEPQAVTLALLWLAVQVVTSLPGGIIYLLEGRGKTGGHALVDPSPERMEHAAAPAADGLKGESLSPLSGQQREEELA